MINIEQNKAIFLNIFVSSLENLKKKISVKFQCIMNAILVQNNVSK